MTVEKFTEIMEVIGIHKQFDDSEQCNVLMGLNIIVKYLPTKGIEATQHDIIYSVDVKEIVEAGITEEDTIKLSELNWMIDEDSLACYV